MGNDIMVSPTDHASQYARITSTGALPLSALVIDSLPLLGANVLAPDMMEHRSNRSNFLTGGPGLRNAYAPG